ncbi:MAG: spermidine/putrescine ABC transporter permease PotB [Legionellaceae bacterium]|nr:spermidine/putrescine ABC transporter permease PotB [Legionellaceae bacterium]
MKNKPFAIYFIYTWLFLFAVIPIAMIVLVSFLSDNSVSLMSLPLTVHHYTQLLSPLFAGVLFRSLIIALFTTIACLVIAYPFTYIIIKSKYQSFWLSLIIIPFWTNSLIRTYSMIAMLKLNGVLNHVLLSLHLTNHPITFLYSNFAVMCGLIYNLFPFMVLPLFSNMERFDFRLIEAAKDLGANRLAIFFRVFLPNTTQGIIAGSLMIFLPAMTLFYIPYVLGGARSLLLGNLIQNQFLVTENWPAGAATSVLLTLTLIMLLLFYRPKKEIVN